MWWAEAVVYEDKLCAGREARRRARTSTSSTSKASEISTSKTSEISDLLSTYAGKEELLLQVGNPPACSCTLCGGRAGIRIASARLYYVKESLIIN